MHAVFLLVSESFKPSARRHLASYDQCAFPSSPSWLLWQHLCMSVQHRLFSADHVVPLARFARRALTAALMHARINLWVFFAPETPTYCSPFAVCNRIAVEKFVLMMTPYLSKSWCVVRVSHVFAFVSMLLFMVQSIVDCWINQYDHSARTNFIVSWDTLQ